MDNFSQIKDDKMGMQIERKITIVLRTKTVMNFIIFTSCYLVLYPISLKFYCYCYTSLRYKKTNLETKIALNARLNAYKLKILIEFIAKNIYYLIRFENLLRDWDIYNFENFDIFVLCPIVNQIVS